MWQHGQGVWPSLPGPGALGLVPRSRGEPHSSMQCLAPAKGWSHRRGALLGSASRAAWVAQRRQSPLALKCAFINGMNPSPKLCGLSWHLGLAPLPVPAVLLRAVPHPGAQLCLLGAAWSPKHTRRGQGAPCSRDRLQSPGGRACPPKDSPSTESMQGSTQGPVGVDAASSRPG